MAVCRDSFGRTYYCQANSWYSWGRWVLLGVIILAFVGLYLCFSCITARRRRKMGQKPIYGTGWAGPGHGQATYNPNYNNQQVPPQYNQNQSSYQPTHGGANQSYFGGQQSGVDAPNNTYQPPAGPPPGKY